jgi:hypothetical protein
LLPPSEPLRNKQEDEAERLTARRHLMNKCGLAALQEDAVVAVLVENAVTGETSRTFDDLTEDECRVALEQFDNLVAMVKGEGK